MLSFPGEEFYEASPYEPVTSRLSDIFRLASIFSGEWVWAGLAGSPLGPVGGSSLGLGSGVRSSDQQTLSCMRSETFVGTAWHVPAGQQGLNLKPDVALLFCHLSRPSGSFSPGPQLFRSSSSGSLCLSFPSCATGSTAAPWVVVRSE